MWDLIEKDKITYKSNYNFTIIGEEGYKKSDIERIKFSKNKYYDYITRVVDGEIVFASGKKLKTK